MKRAREEFQACNHGCSSQNNRNRYLEEDEVRYPALKLPLTQTPELIKGIESLLQQQSQKPKAMNFTISKITIGEWTREAVNLPDLKAKIYFAKKKIMWECLDEATATISTRLVRKIEFSWSNLLSLKPWYDPHDQTGILKLELKNPPKFFIETNPESRKHTQWQEMDQDFTLNRSASRNRIHTLHFGPRVLQKEMEKLVLSGDSFWSKLFKVPFPTSEDVYFDIDYGDNSKNNNGISSSSYSYGQILNFNVNNGLHQGNIQNNTVNMLPVPQVIQPSSQLIIEPYNRGGAFLPGSQLYNYNSMGYQDMSNAEELLGSQAYASHRLHETQTNWTMSQQHTNEPLLHHPQHELGGYEGYLGQEGERQNYSDGNFQINPNQQFGGYDYYSQYMSSNNGGVFPDFNIGDDDFNGKGL